MLQNVCHTPDFDLSIAHATLATRPARSIANVLRLVCEALIEAPAAHRTYEHLKSHGVPHDAALRQALGVAASGTEPSPPASRGEPACH